MLKAVGVASLLYVAPIGCCDMVGGVQSEAYVTSMDLQYTAFLAEDCVMDTTIVPVAEPVSSYSAAEEVRDFSVPNALPPTVTFNFALVLLAPDAFTTILEIVPLMLEVVRRKYDTAAEPVP